MTVVGLRQDLTLFIIDPIIALLLLVAVLVFFWGLIRFLGYLGNDSTEKEKGKQHMVWGVVGIFIMVAALSIINVVADTIGIQPVNTLQPPVGTAQTQTGCPYGVDSQGICNHGPAGQAPY